MNIDEGYLKDYERLYWIGEYYKYYEEYLKYVGHKKEQIKITNSDINMISRLNRVDKNNKFGLILNINCGKDERFTHERYKMIILNSVKMKMCDDENKEIDDDTRLRFENVILSDTWPTIAKCHYRDVRTDDGYKLVKPSHFNQNKHLMIWTSIYKNDSIPDIISGALEKSITDLCINPEYTKFEILFDSWTLDENTDMLEYKKKSIEYLDREELKDVKEKIVSNYIKRLSKETPILSAYKIDWKNKKVTKEN